MLIQGKLPVSYLFGHVKRDVFRVLLVSAGFHIIKNYEVINLPQLPTQLSTILGTSISLLLAFNLNQSYERWWEARKVWGAIVNDSRSLVLQLQAFTGKTSSHAIQKIVRRQIAWCYALARTLRGHPPLLDEVATFLDSSEVSKANQHRNVPLALLLMHSKDLHELREQEQLDSVQQVEIGQIVARLCDSMGMAERIKTTVFPTAYGYFVHLFIYFFLIILSLGLVESIGFLEVPVLTIVASTFFLVEKTARLMQDPFANEPTDTAMTAISRTIEINLRQMMGDAEVPEPMRPKDFYLM